MACGEEGETRLLLTSIPYFKDIIVMSPFTFVLDDPLGNSFIFSELGVDKDPKLKVEHYQRTHDQNEELGLNDLHVNPEEYLDAEDLVK